MLASAVGILGLRLAHATLSPWIPVAAREASFVIVMAGGMLIGHLWTFRVVDGRGWRFVGLGRNAFRPSVLALGAGFGALSIAIPAAILLVLGWLRIEPAAAGSSLGAATASLAVLVPAVAVGRTAGARLCVCHAARALGPDRRDRGHEPALRRAALGERRLDPAAVAVVMLAGIFLGLIRVGTGSLYAAWAAHLAWNVVLVVVLHATVSGLAIETPDYRIVDSGPDWATGGAWGPEGGLFAAAGLVVATWIIFRRPTRREESDA